MDNKETSSEANYTASNRTESDRVNPKTSNSSGFEYKECANCGVSETPLWRKYNDHDLCNACGIYFRVNGFHRPFLPNMRKLLSSARKMGLSCVNCGTKVTSMWRRTPEGQSICNACGLYYRLNGVKRPVSMRKDCIRKRQRKTQQISGVMRLANHTCLISEAPLPDVTQQSLPTQSEDMQPSTHCYETPGYQVSYQVQGQSLEADYGSRTTDHLQYYHHHAMHHHQQHQPQEQQIPEQIGYHSVSESANLTHLSPQLENGCYLEAYSLHASSDHTTLQSHYHSPNIKSMEHFRQI